MVTVLCDRATQEPARARSRAAAPAARQFPDIEERQRATTTSTCGLLPMLLKTQAGLAHDATPSAS